MRVKDIKDIQVSAGGTQIEINLGGLTTTKLQFTYESLEAFVAAAEQALAAAFEQQVTGASSKGKQTVRDVIRVDGLDLVVHEDQSFDLMIVSEDKRNIQVSLTGEQGMVLRKILAGEGAEYKHR
jgi:uncharacterized iron-regulated protein